jgi:uncharacterized membrane protein YuzA (DUF378 family)
MEIVNNIALTLVVIGALNWGLVGMYNYNLVHELDKYFTKSKDIDSYIYIIIGLAALYIIINNTYMYISKKKLFFKHYEFHWCNDGPEGDVHCRRTGYGNKCYNNTCVVDDQL